MALLLNAVGRIVCPCCGRHLCSPASTGWGRCSYLASRGPQLQPNTHRSPPFDLYPLPLLQGGTTSLGQIPAGDVAAIQPAEDLTDAMHQEAEAYRVVAVPHKPKAFTSSSVSPEDYALTE